MSEIDRAAFNVKVAQTGLALSDEQVQALYEMYIHLEPMIALVCRPRPRGVEPALIFRPGDPA